MRGSVINYRTMTGLLSHTHILLDNTRAQSCGHVQTYEAIYILIRKFQLYIVENGY